LIKKVASEGFNKIEKKKINVEENEVEDVDVLSKKT
jgi:hypothetical protein